MTRQRKEIIKKMHALAIEEAADRELCCGYTASDFGLADPFEEAQNELETELAATYGMTAAQYEERIYEICERLPMPIR